jgi:hypothetical protein
MRFLCSKENNMNSLRHEKWYIIFIGFVVLFFGCKSRSISIEDVLANPEKHSGEKVSWAGVAGDTIDAGKDSVLFIFGDYGFVSAELREPLQKQIQSGTNIIISGVFESARTFEAKVGDSMVTSGYLIQMTNAEIKQR